MSPGSVVNHLAAIPEPIHIAWEADPDISGVGVVLSFAITAALALILVVVSFFMGYHGRSASRLTGLQASFQQLGTSLMDQIGITTLAVAVSFFAGSPALSAHSRKFLQLCVSLSNISSLILFISARPTGIKQVLVATTTSLASFSISLHNALSSESVSTELAWLESGTVQVIDDSPLPEVMNAIFWSLANLSVVFSTFGFRRRRVWIRISELGCLILGFPLILLHFTEIRDLYKKYEPYVDSSDTAWSFGQVIPLFLNFAFILSIFEAYMNAPRAEQHPECKATEDTTASQIDVPWYFSLVLPIYLVRKVKFVAILVGAAGASVGLWFLLQWYHRNRAAVRQTSPLAGRITYFRNFLRYALWSNSSHVDYAATTSLGLIPSRIWFTNARKVPPGYRQISWKCSCGEAMAASFDNSDPRALEALERRLQGMSNPGAASAPQQGPAVPATSGSSSGNTGRGTLSSGQGSTGQPSARGRKGSGANTSGVPRRNAASSSNPQRASIPRYFELCVSVGQHSVSLGEINISSVATDSQLFSKIWESYRDIRRSSFGAAIWGWFFKPDDVFFVHFGVTKRHQVGIYGKSMEIPPPEEVDQGRYHYFRCPMQPLPPMPDHIFLHYLDRARRTTTSEKNHQAHAEDIFLNRLPKKLGSSIFNPGTGADAAILYGWGVHIVERPSALAQSMVGIASALICIIIFALTWAFADLGTAIGVGQFVPGVLALANAAIYFALQAYSTRLSRRMP